MTALPSKLPWQAFIDGNDIVVSHVLATWFGGPQDSEDDSLTASGINLLKTPNVMGCALPIIAVSQGKRFAATADSPLAVNPHIPWKTKVVVTGDETGRTYPLALIDNGPNVLKFPAHAIDLTRPAFHALGGDFNVGSLKVSFRVLGVAHLFPA